MNTESKDGYVQTQTDDGFMINWEKYFFKQIPAIGAALAVQ